MKKLIFLRRTSQISFLMLFIYILWSTTYPLEGLLPADTFFKIDPLIIIITSISERIILPGIFFAAVMLILTVLLGRFFCGWVCPLGTIIDMTGTVRKNIDYHRGYPNQTIRSVKFIFLGIIIFLSLLGIQLAWIIDPLVIAARFISLNVIPGTTFLLNNLSIFLIRQLGFDGWFYDLYRNLKTSLLGIQPYFFSNSFILLIFFLAVISTTFYVKRFWCRVVCPLGALYAFFARFSLLRRTVAQCTACGICVSHCRMGAISVDTRKGDSPSIELGAVPYYKSECILCMDCVYDCPENRTVFSFPFFKKNTGAAVQKNDRKGLDRRNFIIFGFCSFFSLGFRMRKRLNKSENMVIRPPAALSEKKFLNRCIRCGNCMKVCVTNGLQPAGFETGITGIWTPKLVPEIGYCEYNCTLCGEVCPTGAIPRLPVDKKRSVRLGLAHIDQGICLPWAEAKECLVCEEHCPVHDKAIKVITEKIGGIILGKPVIDETLCVGCGICQNKCPTRPHRAIKVYPAGAERR